MSVHAFKEYVFDAKDRIENFHGNQLVFIGWDKHNMFCAPFAFPFPPAMPFRAIVENVLPAAFGYHPEFAKIDWANAQWRKAGQVFTPDWDKSLAENGIGHKTSLRFYTEGLNGINGSFS